MSETIETTTGKSVDYKARARRAWETRRANSGKKERVTGVVTKTESVRRRGRPAKAPVARKASVVFGGFEVTSAVYSFDQVRELGAAAVTTDGSSYRLLRQNGTIVPASYFERG